MKTNEITLDETKVQKLIVHEMTKENMTIQNDSRQNHLK